jgi:mannose-6-phosphate isomerase-like protein (cupin superfamily)
MKPTRRSFALLLPALAAAQPSADPLPSKAFKFEDLPSKPNDKTGSNSHTVLDGRTHSGFPVEVHVTELPAGASPHAPHKHVHEEMFMVQSGVVDVTVNGATTRLTPGSVCYVRSNDVHGIHNPGPGRAEYFVTALGAKS